MTNILHIQYQTISVEVEGNKIPDIILDSISGCDIFSWKWNWVGMSWGFWTIEQCGPGPGLARWSPGGQTIQQQESYMAPAIGTTPLTKHIYGHSSQWSSHCSSVLYCTVLYCDPVTAALQPGLANFDIIAQHKYSQGAEKLLCLCPQNLHCVLKESKILKTSKIVNININIQIYKIG